MSNTLVVEDEEEEEFYMRNESNVELLERLLNFSKHGAMMQLFVLDAIHDGIDKVLKDEEATRDAWPERSIVDVDAWLGSAKEMKDALDNRKQIKERY